MLYKKKVSTVMFNNSTNNHKKTTTLGIENPGPYALLENYISYVYGSTYITCYFSMFAVNGLIFL